MNYYHGSPRKFTRFREGIKIHLTPNYEYARIFANKKKNSIGYVYTVEVLGRKNIVFNEGSSNITFYSAEPLKIIKTEEIHFTTESRPILSKIKDAIGVLSDSIYPRL